jgi:hypothetical protein
MARAGVIGFVVLAAALGGWALALQAKVVVGPVMFVLALAPGLAAFASAWTAPGRKFFAGVTQTLLWAAMATAVNAAWAATGHTTDFPGCRGAFWLFTLALLGGVLPAAAGAAAAIWFGRLRGEQRPPRGGPDRD